MLEQNDSDNLRNEIESPNVVRALRPASTASSETQTARRRDARRTQDGRQRYADAAQDGRTTDAHETLDERKSDVIFDRLFLVLILMHLVINFRCGREPENAEKTRDV